MTIEAIEIAIMVDNCIFRTGLVEILTRDSTTDVVAAGYSVANAKDVALRLRPHVMVVDLSTRNSSLEAISEVKRLSPSTRTILVAESAMTDDITEAYKTGASGYVLKTADDDELRRAVRLVHGGATYITPTLASIFIQNPSPADSRSAKSHGLTRREADVVHKVGMGLTNRETARACNISEKTVKHHMTNIMGKLCVRNRVEVALLAPMLMMTVGGPMYPRVDPVPIPYGEDGEMVRAPGYMQPPMRRRSSFRLTL